MAMTLRTDCDGVFDLYNHRMTPLLTYLHAMKLLIEKTGGNAHIVNTFVESTVIMLIMRHEWFLGSLLVHAARWQPESWRAFLGKDADAKRKAYLATFDQKRLNESARSKASFERNGKAIDQAFGALFGFSPWPSTQVLETLLDLNLLRQLFVHHDGGSVEFPGVEDGYYDQLSNRALMTASTYGEFTVRRVNHVACVGFLPTAVQAVDEQVQHLRAEIARTLPT